MFAYLEQILISWANYVPLEIFAPVTSFFEEIIPPIPSPSISIITGSFSQLQGYSIYGVIGLVFLAAFGKTTGAVLVYFISDKIEDLFYGRIGKFIGITHEEIEDFGARLGKGWRDYIILTILRGLPIIPSTLVSVGGGILKINFRLFVVTTFIGSIIRGAIYIFIGYVGMTVLSSFVKSTTTIESIVQITVVLVIIVLLGYLYYKKRIKKV